MRIRTLAVLLVVLAGTAQAECLSAVQADVQVPLGGGASRFQTKLAGGDATLRGRVRPQRGRETVRVELGFDYKIPPGTIAFDEIICGIEVIVADAGGNELTRSDIDPHLINLNPNRVPLFYATTVYTLGGTAVRVRVRGNYE